MVDKNRNNLDPVQVYSSNPPPELNKFIELLADPNLDNRDVDEQMGWPVGETLKKLKRYPLLAKTKDEARVLALKKVGLNRIEAYKAISEALGATQRVQIGVDEWEDRPNHKIRLEAAQKILDILGDDGRPLAGVNLQQINNTIAIGVEDSEMLNNIVSRMGVLAEKLRKGDGLIIDDRSR